MRRVIRSRIHHKPGKPCQEYWTADFGWGEIEYHPCRYPSTHVIKLPARLFFEAEKMFVCDRHKRAHDEAARRYYLVNSTDERRTYRFRKL